MKRHHWILLGITLLALTLRAYAFWWGYPYSLHVDEYFDFTMVRRMERLWATSRSLNINSSQYGLLSYDLLWLINSATARLAPGLSLVYEGRLLSALCGALTVPVLYWLGKALYNQRTGLIGAVFYAITPIAVQYAHFYTPDSLLLLEISLSVVACVRLMQEETWQNYLLVGLAFGVTLATKPTGLALAGPLLVAVLKHLWPKLQARFSRGPILGLVAGAHLSHSNDALSHAVIARLARLLVCLAVIVMVFIVINPYSVTDARNYWGYNKNDDLRVQLDMVSGRIKSLYASQFAGSLPYWYHLTRTLPYGLGPLLELLSIAGVLYSLWRARRGTWNDWLLLAWVVPFFFTVGGAYIKFVRYLLPILPFTALLAARLLVDAYWGRRTEDRRSRMEDREMAFPSSIFYPQSSILNPLRSAALIAGILTLATTLFWTLSMNDLLRRPDARVQAITWMQQNIPAGASLLVEKDGALRLDDMKGRYGIDPERWQVTMLDLYDIDGVKSVLYQPPDVDPARKAAYLQSRLGPEWIVMSDNWPDSFMPLAQYYPVEAEYYRKLLNGEAGYDIVKQFKEYPGLFGLRINDDNSELTWRIYDHPRVYILHRRR